MRDTESAIELAFYMGELLLSNGAEISRVQETMERVAGAFQVEEFNVYVLTNGIFANGTERGVPHNTKLKYFRSSSMHLARITEVNQLSREIAAGGLTVPEAFARAEEIEKLPYTAKWIQILACGVSSAGFCYIFGGNLLDSLCALLVGLAVQVFLLFAEKHNLSKLLTNLCGSALTAACAVALVLLGPGTQLEMIIAGSIIRLVPGVALTTSIRDFFNGDYLSGTIRLIDALIVGICLALGAGVVIKLSSVIGGVAL